jgi:polysaccharide biosynthesis protein PslH
MPRRKILILTNRIPYPLRDGGNLAMNAMVEGYHAAGWQVYLLSMNTSRHYVEEAQLKQLFTHLYRFEWVNVNNDISMMGLLKNFIFSRQPEHAVRFDQAVYRNRLEQVLTHFEPDVVQVESVYLTTYMPSIKAKSNAVTVLRMHNVEYQIWSGLAQKHKNALKRFYFNDLSERVRHFEREAWKEYDLLLPITEKDASQVSRLEDIDDMVVVPFSIDTDKIVVSGVEERWVGYHIGAMDWIANRDGVMWFLKEAWPGVRKAVPSFEFYFAGRSMPEEFKKLNIPGVHCLDEVPSANDFIADKKILIVPLWSGGGIRVKILEAMAAGKVVITTPKGIKGIEARTGEHYLQARTADDFVQAIKWCVEHKDAAAKMGELARALIEERYDNKKVIGKVIEEVELLLAARNG